MYLTIFGYWYNLPIISTGIFGGYNEFRIYDFTTIIFYLFILTTDWSKVKEVLEERPNIKKLFKFTLWCTLMTPVAIFIFLIDSNFTRIGSTIIYLHHLWGFFLTGVFLLIIYKQHGIKNLIIFFLATNVAVLLIFYIQRVGLLKSFWNIRYIEGYGEEMTLSATLGPNRIVFGMMTSMGFIFALFILLSKKYSSTLIRVLLITVLIFSLPAIVMAGSRTSFIFIFLFIAIYTIFFNRKLLIICLLLLPVIPKFYGGILSERHIKSITGQVEYNKRKLLHGDRLSDISLIEGYERLGSRRPEILRKSIIYLVQNPYIWPFGSGFNNQEYSGRFIGAAMPHNIYVALIIELGIVGLILYIRWYLSYIKYALNSACKRSIKGLLISLIFAMLISLFAGEHMYIYRAHFAMFGTFILILTIIELVIEEIYIEDI